MWSTLAQYELPNYSITNELHQYDSRSAVFPFTAARPHTIISSTTVAVSISPLVGARSVQVVVFLSGSEDAEGNLRSDYMTSSNCIRELRCAVGGADAVTMTRVIFVLEKDKDHGGVPIAIHLDAVSADIRSVLQAAVDADEVVPWRRLRAFQLESLRSLIQQVRSLEPWIGDPPSRMDAAHHVEAECTATKCCG